MVYLWSLRVFQRAVIARSLSAAGAAPATACVVPALAQVDRGASGLSWRLTQHQGLLRLQLMGHGHKDGLHVITVPALLLPAAWTLSRGLEQRHGVGVGKLLRRICSHLQRLPQVALVAH